jgi:hypothetical protein
MADLTFIHAADLHLDSPFYGISNLPCTFCKIKKQPGCSGLFHLFFGDAQRLFDRFESAGVSVNQNAAFVNFRADRCNDLRKRQRIQSDQTSAAHLQKISETVRNSRAVFL